ncbi:HIT domain-containing protein [Ahrensia marina]|uniref:Histidine triad (HIT) protein n=1 Tax=Ahrensia marina TaxID=1514904 RepID=A0A0N0E6Z8_9HYPH|nr:HIT domain-containing protein [Ahrensia marina]KPB00542.1 histidine triad (HIT) protein [Ahrensia marina]
MADFKLDSRLSADTIAIGDSGLCRLLLMDDSRFPWLIMVPRRFDITEVHELTPLDQTVLTFEIAQVSEILKDITGCKKINIGALGNMVPQLHIHIIGRNEGDIAWPGPVWGAGKSVPYDEKTMRTFIERFSSALQQAS